MFFVYVLWSERLGRRYTGSCSDPGARVEQHNSGQTKYTSRGVPWALKYVEQYGTNSEARKRERYLKTGAGRYFLDRVFEGHPDYPAEELPPNCRATRLY